MGAADLAAAAFDRVDRVVRTPGKPSEVINMNMQKKLIHRWTLCLLLLMITASLVAVQALAQGGKLDMTWGKLPCTGVEEIVRICQW